MSEVAVTAISSFVGLSIGVVIVIIVNIAYNRGYYRAMKEYQVGEFDRKIERLQSAERERNAQEDRT